MPLLLMLSALCVSRLSSRTGHRMRASDLASPQGRNLDLKERAEREIQTRGPRGRRERPLIRGLSSRVGIICTVRPLRIGIKSEEVGRSAKGKRG